MLKRALVAILFCVSLFAQETPKITVVKAGKLLDVRSGAYQQNVFLVIAGDRIRSIEPASYKAPADATVVDLSAATVLPGLIDCHTHITFNPEDIGLISLTISPPVEALNGAANARKTLDAGFTTIRNVGSDGFADVALRDAINKGILPGPRMLVSGPGLSITGGHGDINELPWDMHVASQGTADGVEGVQRKVRQNIKHGADLIKIMATGGVLSKGDDPQASAYTQEELRAIVADAHRLGRKVAAHAHGAQGILWAAEAGVDSIEHGTYINDEGLAAMKKHGTYLVPTLYLTEWFPANAARLNIPPYIVAKMNEVLPLLRKNIQHAFASGVKVALGSDAAVYPHGMNARELQTYVALGMTPLQALQSATVNAADLLGWSDRVGTLEAGRYADLIAVPGDPLQDISALQHVTFVMKGGQVVRNNAR